MSEVPYSPIRVSTLRGDLKIPFDVYVYVADHHILYCRRGDSFEGKRLDRLKAKKLKRMYIRKEDEIPYRQYLEASIDQAYDAKSGKALELRAEVIQGFQQAEAENFMEDPLNGFSYSHVKSSMQRFAEFLGSEPLAIAALLNLKNSDHSITHHGVNVAAVSLGIMIDNGMREGQPTHLMAAGCLLHDFEHFFSGVDVGRPLSTLLPADLEIYKEHPLKGAHRLQGSTFIDQMVLNIITQHEEHMDGSGFPKGLFEKDMDPLVLVAGTANAFDRMISFEGMPPKDAMKAMLIQKMGMYPLAHLQSLQTVLKRQKLV